MRISKSLVLVSAFFLFACSLSVLAQSEWTVTNTLHIGGEGGWDYLTVDSQTHRLYVPRSTHTMVIDSESGRLIGDIPGQKRAHGVAIVAQTGRGFISDGGGDGAVVVFDLKTNTALGTIAAQPDADGIIYDASVNRVLVVSGDGGTLMSFKPDIDPTSGKIEAPIELGGKPEFLASDGNGKLYINLVDKDNVAVVDFKARKVIAHWPVGKVISDLPIGAGVDATKFDRGKAFASCRDGSLAVASETSPGKFEIVQSVKTPQGARTMGVDPTTHRIYLPTAEYEEPKPGATGRPAMKPGTFMIVVVARHAP
jgi:DNA-binding beta-propeller fold protein YncE